MVWQACKTDLRNAHRMVLDRDCLSVQVSASSRRTSASKWFKAQLRDRWSKDDRNNRLGFDLDRAVLYTTRKTLIT